MSRLVPVLVLWLFWQEAAQANQPPEPPALLATLAILPVALLFFVLSGAAAFYDRQAAPGTRPGRRRIWGLVVATIAAIGSGAHEGFTALLAPVLALFALAYAVRMVRVPEKPAPAVSPWLPRVAGLLLIPITVFLAGFSWAFLGSYRLLDSPVRGVNVVETLQRFARYQRKYAATHKGIYRNIVPVPFSPAWDESRRKDREASGVLELDRLTRWETRVATITYGKDFRRYEVWVTPASFLPRPYRYLFPRYAYYMDQTGVIRREKVTGPGRQASARSPAAPVN